MSCFVTPEAIGACANVITAITVGAGVWIAYSQLGQWKREAKTKRAAEVASELIACIYSATDAIDMIRSPGFQGSESPGGGVSVYDQILERLQRHIPEFEDLRRSQVSVRALIGDEDVDKAVEEIFNIRQEVYAAVVTLRTVDRGDGVEPAIDGKFAFKLQMEMHSTRGRHDALWPRQKAAIETIEQKLYPIARMEK